MIAADKSQHREQVNALLALPQVLKTEDGRILRIRVWEPRADFCKLVTVKIEAIVLPALPPAPEA